MDFLGVAGIKKERIDTWPSKESNVNCTYQSIQATIRNQVINWLNKSNLLVNLHERRAAPKYECKNGTHANALHAVKQHSMGSSKKYGGYKVGRNT